MQNLFMKRQLNVILIIGLGLFVSASQKQEKAIANEDNLYGKVKMMTEYTYHAEMTTGNIVKTDSSFYQKSVIRYDKNGNRIEYTEYNSDGSIGFRNRYLYDHTNRIGMELLDSDGTVLSKTIYHFDQHNNPTESVDHPRNFKSIYKCDSKGNVLEESNYSSGRFESKTVWKYNDSNQVMETISYNESGEMDTRWVTRYSNNRVVRERYIFDESLEFRSTTDYDSLGNPVKEENIYLNPTDKKSDWTTTYEYTLDENVNWVKCVEKNSFYNRIKIIERTFEYYK